MKIITLQGTVDDSGYVLWEGDSDLAIHPSDGRWFDRKCKDRGEDQCFGFFQALDIVPQRGQILKFTVKVHNDANCPIVDEMRTKEI